MSYSPDPGGVFASDAHRRVMAHLPNPQDDPVSIEDLIIGRINHDPHTLSHFDSADDVLGVLRDLEADGYAKELKSGWKNTAEGFDVLIGPPTAKAAAEAPATIGLDPATLNGG